jgi:hypothetical protein
MMFYWAYEFSSYISSESKSFFIFIGSQRMRRPLIKRKDFHNFHWIKRTNSRRGHGKLGVRVVLSCVFSLGKGGKQMCERRTSYV